MSEQHAAWLRLHKASIFETETRARSCYRPMGEIGAYVVDLPWSHTGGKKGPANLFLDEDWPVVWGEGKGGSAERDESSASRPRHEMLSETLDEETFPRGS
ncbi:hypothetical protein E4U31_002311 [Claviceps sp. LM219 group G6]|nr:hypothetical protein E4U31_002311 [Claviceps sp. LM219 group G6]